MIDDSASHTTINRPAFAGYTKRRYTIILLFGLFGIVLPMVLFFLGQELERGQTQK